jgi:hypothetical protein
MIKNVEIFNQKIKTNSEYFLNLGMDALKLFNERIEMPDEK